MRWLLLFLSLTVCTAHGAAAQKLLGKFGGWRVGVTQVGSEQTCVVSNRPADGGSYILVTLKAQSRDPAVVTFGLRPGVDLQKPIEARIGPRQFPLMAREDRAWATSDKDEARLLAAMEAGKNLVVFSHAQGKMRRDTYHLQGFSQAWSRAYAGCTP